MRMNIFGDFLKDHYEIYEWKHAAAILKNDFPQEWNDIIETLTNFRFRKSWITVGGGSKSKVAEAIDTSLYAKGWKEKSLKQKLL